MKQQAHLEIEMVSVDELKPYEGNAKIHDNRNVGQIASSIEEFNFADPIAAWHNDKGESVIIEGHGRLLAAQMLGIKELPVIYLDYLTDEQRRAYTIVHNSTTMSTGFDMETLEVELGNIIDIDMSQFDFDVPSPSVGEPTDIAEDEVPEVAPSIVQNSDVWQLGRHRLMCGDARSADDVRTLLDGATVDLNLTDPPYGVQIVKTEGHIGGAKPFGSKAQRGSTHRYAKNAIIPQPREYAPIIGDESTDTARDNYEIAKEVSDVQIIFGGNYFTDFLPPSRCWIVWDKKVPRESFFAQVELAWCSKDGNSLIYEHQWSGLIREGSRDLELETRVHPTQKPVGMLADIISDFTDDDGTVMDCFGGSGSTLIAAEHTGRTCYCMELSPEYCDIIIERWQNLTGQTARKVEQDG